VANKSVYRGGVLRVIALAAFCVVCVTQRTYAQTPQATSAAPAPAPSRAPAILDSRDRDPHVDRVLLVPTAETQPQGTAFMTAYELILPQVGYAFSDRLQVSLFGFTDFSGGGFFELRVKANVLRLPLLRIAVGASVDYLFFDDVDEGEDEDLLIVRPDAVLQLCFERLCRSSLSIAGSAVMHAQTELLLPIMAGAGVTLYVVPALSFLLEYSAMFNAADDLDLVALPLHQVSYGVRVSWTRSWALDVGLLRVLNPERDIVTKQPQLFDLLGVPLLAISYRFGMRASTTYP
jgi:hypothetical protein